MMKHAPKLTPNEFVIGFIYFALQLTILPVLLVLAGMLLPTPLSEAGINFLFFAVNFIAVVCIFRRFLLDNLRLAREVPWVTLRCAAIGLGIYFVGTTLLTGVITWFQPEFANINDMSIMTMVQQRFGLMAFGTVFLVPVAEETFYRGLIFRQLFDRSPFWAYLVSTVCFSAVHIAGYVGMFDWLTLLLCFFQYLPAGLALAWCYHRSGTIFSPILVHMAVNLVGMLAMR